MWGSEFSDIEPKTVILVITISAIFAVLQHFRYQAALKRHKAAEKARTTK